MVWLFPRFKADVVPAGHQVFVGTPAQGLGIVGRSDGSGFMMIVDGFG